MQNHGFLFDKVKTSWEGVAEEMGRVILGECLSCCRVLAHGCHPLRSGNFHQKFSERARALAVGKISTLSLVSALLVGIERLTQEQLLEVFFFRVNEEPCSAPVVLPMRAAARLSVARKR
jgi:hypothetical protein